MVSTSLAHRPCRLPFPNVSDTFPGHPGDDSVRPSDFEDESSTEDENEESETDDEGNKNSTPLAQQRLIQKNQHLIIRRDYWKKKYKDARRELRDLKKQLEVLKAQVAKSKGLGPPPTVNMHISLLFELWFHVG